MMKRTSRLRAFRAVDLAVYREAWAQPGALTAMLNWYRALRRGIKGPERVRVPTLVLWGTRDPALERGLAEASLGLCDAGRIRWFETAGHWVQHEEPAAVSEALAGFFSG
jgi:pimeloyl-ACP methyl ester carboxylesterase